MKSTLITVALCLLSTTTWATDTLDIRPNVEDGYYMGYSDYDDWNFGTSIYLYCVPVMEEQSYIRFADHYDSLPNYDSFYVTHVYVMLHTKTVTSSGDVRLRVSCRERLDFGSMNFDYWDTVGTDMDWTSEGGATGGTNCPAGGNDNDGSGSDYQTTYQNHITVSSGETWYSWPVDTSYFFDHDSDGDSILFQIYGLSGTNMGFYSTDNTTAAKRPKLRIIYEQYPSGGVPAGSYHSKANGCGGTLHTKTRGRGGTYHAKK